MLIHVIGNNRVERRRFVGRLVGLSQVVLEQCRTALATLDKSLAPLELVTLPTTALDTFGALGAFERAFATRLVVGALHEDDFHAFTGTPVDGADLVDAQVPQQSHLARCFVRAHAAASFCSSRRSALAPCRMASRQPAT